MLHSQYESSHTGNEYDPSLTPLTLGLGTKILTVGPCFQVFTTIQGKRWAKHLLSLLGFAIAMITPMRQARTCGRVRAQGPTQSALKHWESDVHGKS